MGVNNFFDIVISKKTKTTSAEKISDLGELVNPVKGALDGDRIGIDASNTIYRSILAMPNVAQLTDASGKITSHINTIFNQIIMYETYGIKQLWLFDSPNPNELKKEELAKRNARRDATADDDKNADKIRFKMTSEHVNDIKQLLELMGQPYAQAPDGIEAEQIGAYLTTTTATATNHPYKCKYFMSSDSDVLVFGGDLIRLAKMKIGTSKTSKTVYQTFSLTKILEKTGLMELNVGDYKLAREDLCSIAAHLGTDFCEKTPNIGPVNVLSKYKDGVLELTKQQSAAVKYFMLDVSKHATDMAFLTKTYNRKGVEEFLKSRNFGMEKISKRLDNYESIMKKNSPSGGDDDADDDNDDDDDDEEEDSSEKNEKSKPSLSSLIDLNELENELEDI